MADNAQANDGNGVDAPSRLATAAASRRRIRYAVMVLVLMVLSRIAGMLPVFRDVLQEYLKIGDQRYGLMFSIGLVGGLLTVLPAGVLADRRGPVAIIRLGLVGAAVALGLLACAGSTWWLIAIGLGVSQMMVRPLGLGVNAFLVRLFPGNKRRIISLNAVALSGGEFIFPALAESLLMLARRVPAITFAMVLHASFALAAVFVGLGGLLFRPRAVAATPPHATSKNLMHGFHFKPRTWGLILLATLHGMADTTLFFWWARFLGSSVFPEQPIPPGVFMSGFAVAYFVSRSSLALLPERRWRRAFMVVPGPLGGLTLLSGILSGSYLLTGFSYVLGGLLWSAEMPTFLSRMAEEDEAKFGAALAMQQMLAAAATAIGLAAMGLLIENMTETHMWRAMLIPAAVFPLVGLGGAVWLWRTPA